MSCSAFRGGVHAAQKNGFSAWELWFDRWWKLAKRDIRSAVEYGCDPLLLGRLLYDYSCPTQSAVDAIRKDRQALNRGVEGLMLQMLRAAKQAEALELRLSKTWLVRTPQPLGEVAARLYADVERLGKMAKLLRRLSSRSGINRNYLLVFLDEYVKRATGRYRRILVANLVWASNGAHLPPGQEERAQSPTDDAVGKATRDLKKKQPQAYAAILRAVQRAPGFSLDSIIEEAALKSLTLNPSS